MGYAYKKSPRLLHQCLDDVASCNPDAIAIDEGARQISYGALKARADRLAGRLQKNGLRRSDRVGIFALNSIESTVAIFGTLKADGCYVPIHPEFPSGKIADIIEDAGIKTLLLNRASWDPFKNFVLKQEKFIFQMVIMLDPLVDVPNDELEKVKATCKVFVPCEVWDNHPVHPRSEENISEDLAYIMYTSGTTGRPKGVMLTHKNVIAFCDWVVSDYGFCATDRFSHHNRIGFDFSVMDIFACFFAGGTLCPVINKGDISFPGAFIQRLNISIWISVPSSLNMMVKARQMAPQSFPSLRMGFVCGEILRKDTAAHWLKTHPHVPLINLYGPTEAAVACTAHSTISKDVVAEWNSIPIGKPSPETEILLLRKDEDELASVGEIGRLMICGTQVAPGYWQKKELTQQCFRNNLYKEAWYRKMYDTGDLALRREDGVLIYIGREDQQVQVMGFRVELTEVEAAYEGFLGCEEVAVVFEAEKHWLILALAVNSKEQEQQILKSFFAHGQAHLSEHMVPKKVIFYPDLPKNSNGKVDRKKILQDFLKC